MIRETLFIVPVYTRNSAVLSNAPALPTPACFPQEWVMDVENVPWTTTVYVQQFEKRCRPGSTIDPPGPETVAAQHAADGGEKLKMKYLCLGYLDMELFDSRPEAEKSEVLSACYKQCVPFRETRRIIAEAGL